jgi:hypothetical protein
MSDTEKDAVVDRYQRGQTIRFIAYALDLSFAKVRAVLSERGVEVKRSSERNRSWGFNGSAA